MKPAKEICPTTTLEKVKNGALIIDVRNESEVEEINFDVPNYMHIPLSELEDRISEIPKNEEIVMVCKSGERSLRTTYFLMNAGYENVYNMRDGIVKWTSKGFPIKGNTDSLLNIDSCDCSQTDCC